MPNNESVPDGCVQSSVQLGQSQDAPGYAASTPTRSSPRSNLFWKVCHSEQEALRSCFQVGKHHKRTPGLLKLNLPGDKVLVVTITEMITSSSGGSRMEGQ